jgi:RNA:NAD 2'-phosphotransferase (TPT1/KptA family)
MRVYHATAVSNVESIREKGLLKVWEGVYLTDSEESAQRWIGFRLKAMGHDKIAIIVLKRFQYPRLKT